MVLSTRALPILASSSSGVRNFRRAFHFSVRASPFLINFSLLSNAAAAGGLIQLWLITGLTYHGICPGPLMVFNVHFAMVVASPKIRLGLC